MQILIFQFSHSPPLLTLRLGDLWLSNGSQLTKTNFCVWFVSLDCGLLENFF